MDGSVFILLLVIISFVLFLFQRSEPKKRRIVLLIMLPLAVLLRNYVWYRDVHTEAWAALILALLLNGFFWLFIGRYNPVTSSDQIKVYGLDD
jgi:uncharacterized protein YqhQ